MSMSLNNMITIGREEADHGFVSNESGIVICGACLAGAHSNAVAGGYGGIATAMRLSYERFDPSAGDDWCSNCDKDIPHRQSMPHITVPEANAEVREMIAERERNA
jgi:hypothetical protein